MKSYFKIGRDIVVGKGFSAKHWAGPIVFGKEAIYLLPNGVSVKSLRAGYDSASAAAGMLGGIIGGAIAGALQGKDKSKPTWQENIAEINKLPPEVLSDPDWSMKKGKRPVILIKKDDIDKFERSGGKLMVEAYGDTFKLGLKLFGRGKAIEAMRNLGWAV
ncbi:MAG: hypothetical protein ACMUIL_10665 [bacterium]